MVIFDCYVSLPEGISYNGWIQKNIDVDLIANTIVDISYNHTMLMIYHAMVDILWLFPLVAAMVAGTQCSFFHSFVGSQNRH